MFRGLTFIAGAVLVFSLVLAACGADELDRTPASGSGAPAEPTATPAAEQPGLGGTAWLLVDLDGKPVPDVFEASLHFNDGQAGGTVCNSYGGAFESDRDGTLSFIDVFQTEMYCTEPDGLMDLESDYISALQDVSSYQVEDDRLSLMDAGGSTMMTFTLQERLESLPLDGTSWVVVQIDGEPVIDGAIVTATFEDGMVTGDGGCNLFGGEYTATLDGKIDIFDLVTTLMGCMDPEGVVAQENDFETALREATAYELDGDTLRLLDDAGTVRLLLDSTFDPDEPVADDPSGLKGTTWAATAINGEPVESDQPYTLQFAVNGPTGKAGCASWWMQFVMESDGSITHETRVSPSVYGAFCDDEAEAADAQLYVDTMASATSYIADGVTLHLMDDQGMAVLEFQRGLDGGELDSTSWILTTLNGEAPLDGTNLTLTFDFEWATGESGCNGFGGAYMVAEPGKVVFADVAHTDMGCMDPDGVMEQEAAYFETLYQVTGYVMTDDRLQLLDANGETILVYEPMS